MPSLAQIRANAMLDRKMAKRLLHIRNLINLLLSGKDWENLTNEETIMLQDAEDSLTRFATKRTS